MKYRKKPVVIEAIQFDNNFTEIEKFCEGNYDWSEGKSDIKTLEGIMKVSKGDYVIKGVKGEFYPCKPDVFQMTYEPEIQESNNKQSSLKIQENWEQIEKIEKIVQEKTGDLGAGFNANLYFFGEEGRHILIPCKYRKPKKDGSFTDKYFEMDIMIHYCPFTGKPLYENSDEVDNEQR